MNRCFTKWISVNVYSTHYIDMNIYIYIFMYIYIYMYVWNDKLCIYFWNSTSVWNYFYIIQSSKWCTSEEELCILQNAGSSIVVKFRARLHDTQSELKPVWYLKPLWNVVPFTWQFKWRFHCGNFPSNGKTLLHLCKWYLLISAKLINTKKCSQW